MFFHLNGCKWKSVITYTILNPDILSRILYMEMLCHILVREKGERGV